MLVIPTGFTIAEYCGQMDTKSIVVNREYQRSAKVWPAPAKSYFIDTILNGYPVPKICLYQSTDLKSRRTVKEIVDGQQRSNAIREFYNDKLRLGKVSDSFNGKLFSDLDPQDQERFVSYNLSADVFASATVDQIRQMFRRINSYTIPLNPEEQRHATNQGAFKWFILSLCEEFSSLLKTLDVFAERSLIRMADAKLFTEIIVALEQGITTYSKTRLDRAYSDNNDKYINEKAMRNRFDKAFATVIRWEELHSTALMKQFVFYSLFLAVIHCLRPADALRPLYEVNRAGLAPDQVVLTNLSQLSSALEDASPPSKYAQFVKACSEGTNTEKNRGIRFKWLCKALQDK